MVTLAGRITELRTAKGLSREALSKELGLPRLSVEKFETGRITPSRQQQEKIAKYFGVPVEYLNGTSDDTTTMAGWLSAYGDEPDETPAPVKKAKPKPAPVEVTPGEGTSVLSSMLKTDAFRQAVLDVLRSPEGQELIRKALKK